VRTGYSDLASDGPLTKQTFGKGIAGQAAKFTVGNIVYVIGQFVFLTLLASLGDPLLVGAYGLATAILNPLFFFTKLGMRRAQAADATEHFTFSAYQTLRNIVLVAAFLLGLACMPFLPAEEGMLFVFGAILLSRVAECSADLYYGFLLQRQAQGIIAISLALRAVGCVAFFLVLYWLTGSPVYAVAGMPLGWALVYFAYDRPQSEALMPGGQERERPSRATLWMLFRTLWPLAITGALSQVQQSFPRLWVSQVLDIATLGAIMPALQLHVMVMTLGQSVAQSLLPSLAVSMQKRGGKGARRQVLTAVGVLIVPLLAGIAVAFLWGEWLVQLVFGQGYELSGMFLGLTAISWTLRLVAQLFQNVNIASRLFDLVLRIQIVVTVVFVVAGILFWFWLGIAGVFYALVAGNAVNLILCAWTALRNLPARSIPEVTQ
jgi:O-antigen/teichoic acid export membrane protein